VIIPVVIEEWLGVPGQDRTDSTITRVEVRKDVATRVLQPATPSGARVDKIINTRFIPTTRDDAVAGGRDYLSGYHRAGAARLLQHIGVGPHYKTVTGGSALAPSAADLEGVDKG
jgi:hypothetical protein